MPFQNLEWAPPTMERTQGLEPTLEHIQGLESTLAQTQRSGVLGKLIDLNKLWSGF